MSSHDRIARASDQLVTASALVRQFGLWQDRAQRAPVYILHRGRPRLVLTSLDLMEALCTPHERGGDAARQRLDAMLDGTREAIVLADEGCRVLEASRAARATFAIGVGDALAAITPDDPFLDLAATRVSASRTAETIELRHQGRRYSCAIEPFPGGLALFIADVTDSQAQRSCHALALAGEAALAGEGGAALVPIGLRGYVEQAGTALVRLTGVPAEALTQARFVSLFAVESRVALGTAIEQAADGQVPPVIAASLLVNRAAPRPVRVALAPIRGARAVDGVCAAVRAVDP